MEAVFQLVRIRRPSTSSSLPSLPSPTSPVSSPPWTLEVSESTRTLLEDITQPVVVISYLSLDREVRDALWEAFKDVYGWQVQSTTTTTGGQEDAARMSLGIWGWISPPDTSLDDDEEVTEAATVSTGGGESLMGVRKIHLLYGGDFDAEEFEEDDGMIDDEGGLKKGERDVFQDLDLEGVEKVVWSLSSLCSTYLTVVSPGLEATRKEMERLAGFVQPLVGVRTERSSGERERAVLDWRWVGQDIALQDQDRDLNLDGYEDDGRVVLESLLEDDNTEDQEAENSMLLLDTISKAFGGIECKPPMPVGVEWSRRGSEVDAIRAEAETGTFRILCDYSVDDNKAEKRFQWIRSLWRSFDSPREVEDGGDEVAYPRVFSGAILCSRIQACLTHLNKLPHSFLPPHHSPIQQQFNAKELQTTLQDLIRERALSIGMRTYHREMNAFLDRRPIPLPWHTLAMVHLRAQSVACEEIEARFWGAGEGDVRGGLRRVMKEFRRPCVVTEANGDDDGDIGGGVGKKEGGGHKKEEVKEVKKVKEGKGKGGEGMVVPGGGLYLEYYSANAAALQEHHLCSLDELWQVMLKNRLPGVKNGVGGVGTVGGVGGGGGGAVEGSSPGLAKNVSQIKDYTEFLLAVDQVRRGYLESCIPSPEALSVLENLDEMQQSESILFLQTLAANAPLSVNTSATASANGANGAAATGTQQQPASAKGLPSKRYSITNHPTVALNGRELMIHPASGDDSRISNTSGSGGMSGGGMMGSGSRRSSTTQGMDGAPTTDLEQQIADILLSKHGRRGSQDHSGDVSRKPMVNTRSTSRGAKRTSAMSLFQGIINSTKTGQTTTASAVRRKDEDKAVVQFGWTFHLRHANSLQYAWIWDWLSTHAGSSHQNVVACDNKIYTASKWMVLPARDTIASRTRPGKQKEWRIAYGDRVWLVSYWYSTRNAIMELPEYLPRARGAPCGHVVPYGETFVICRTCPTDVLCMRCFRASDHVDHSMYLQCSWGDSICVCGDPSRLKENGHGHGHHGLHCSIHSAEPERAYSGLAKGRPCGIVFLPGETIYKCKSCLIDEEEDKALCVRCFHSQGHFGHDVVVQVAEGGSHCSCEDGYSWREDLICSYHSPGELELEYRPKTISPNGAYSTATPASNDSLTAVAATVREEHRCEHVFQQGEDIYHCHDCSIHEAVALCSRCFFASDCVTHQWRAGQFSSGAHSNKRGSSSTVGSGSGLVDDALATVVDGLGISQGGLGGISTSSLHPLVQQQQDEPEEEEIVARCGCGDPGLFRKAFDCNYHLPRAFRPVPQSHHCGYLFQREEIMIRCRTCHVFNFKGEEEEDVWICGRCFDPALHEDHETEEAVNYWNEGLYCRCGDPTILRGGVTAVAGTEVKCRDDHNRQTVLCATEIKNGMFFYRCQSCQIDAKWVFCEGCFVQEAHEGHSYERRLCTSVATEGMKGLKCGCGENSAFRCATHCRKHERVGGTNVVLRCQYYYYARAGEWISFCRDCYPSEEGVGGVGGYLCQRCRESSDHSGHTDEWVQLEEDTVIFCACGSRRRTLPPEEEEEEEVGQDGRTTTLGQSPSSQPSLCGYHTMRYKTTPSTTLFLHSSRDHQPSNHHHDDEDRSEVSGCKYHDSDNDWILHRAPASSISSSSTPYPSSKEDWLLRWKDTVWLEHANTGRYFGSMAGYKNGQGFQEVVCADDMDEEDGGDGDHEWVVEETTWVRQHILGQ